jgi:hypothetical protein
MLSARSEEFNHQTVALIPKDSLTRLFRRRRLVRDTSSGGRRDVATPRQVHKTLIQYLRCKVDGYLSIDRHQPQEDTQCAGRVMVGLPCLTSTNDANFAWKPPASNSGGSESCLAVAWYESNMKTLQRSKRLPRIQLIRDLEWIGQHYA